MEHVFGLFSVSSVLALVVLFLFYISFKAKRNKAWPGIYAGWIPWIGCAFEFGISPLDFIEKKRREMGSVYTLYVAGERLTFVTDPKDYHHFFQSPNVDFQKAVQDPVQNVASVSEKSFFLHHTKIHDMVKGKLASSRLVHFTEGLQHEFENQLQELDSKGTDDLCRLVRKTMYPAVINNLFGKGVLPVDDKEEFKVLEKHFVMFDEQFEYGARLPAFSIRSWSESKQYLLGLFRKVVRTTSFKQTAKEETLLETLMSIVDKPHAPNYGLLLLWASLANAIPITFWTLSFILNDKRVLSILQKQIDEVLKEQESDEKLILSEDVLQKMPYLKWCVLEAVRIRPTGIITRRVVKTFEIGDLVIPEGDLLMLSPYWSHRNEQYFPDAESYKPERWRDADLEKNLFLDGFVAFGGGRYQCPGRWYALLEMQMYVALFLYRFKCRPLVDKVSPPSTKHLVGTQQPAEPHTVEYELRRH